MSLNSSSCWFYSWFLFSVSEEPRELQQAKSKPVNHSQAELCFMTLAIIFDYYYLLTQHLEGVWGHWITALECLQWGDLTWGGGEQSGDPRDRAQTDFHSTQTDFHPFLSIFLRAPCLGSADFKPCSNSKLPFCILGPFETMLAKLWMISSPQINGYFLPSPSSTRMSVVVSQELSHSERGVQRKC